MALLNDASILLMLSFCNNFTPLSECVFEVLFKGVGTIFGLQNVEKCLETAF